MEAFGLGILLMILVLPGLPFAIAIDIIDQKLSKERQSSAAGMGPVILAAALIGIPVTIAGIGFFATIGFTNLAASWGICYLVSWTVMGLLQIK